jgi:hypothetical protein
VVARLSGNISHNYAGANVPGYITLSGRFVFSNGANTFTRYAEDNGSGGVTNNPVIHYGTSLHSGSMPAAADVRYPVSYGPGGAYTGTCRVPAAASVAYGVPVDNTTGTAVLTPSAVANAILDESLSGHTADGTVGKAISDAAAGGGGGGGGDPGTIAAAVWSNANRTLTAFSFPVTVAVNNDKTGYTLTTDYDRAKTALANTEYTPPDNAGVAAIKAKTDHLTFDASDRVIANAAVNQDKTGYSLTPDYDRSKDALKVTEYQAPDNATIGTISTKADAIKAKTDKLTFNASNQVEAVVSGIDIDEGTLGAAVWDAMRGDHQAPGTTGEALSAVMAMAGGSGARVVTVTVTDGASPLEGAKVRFTKGGESYVKTTSATGEAQFSLDDGTWLWTVTLAGYQGQTNTLVVDGDKLLSVVLTAVGITPSDPGLITGYVDCYDELGNPETGVTIYARAVMTPPGSGIVIDSTIRSATSDAAGRVVFTNLIRGAAYNFRRGNFGHWVPVRIPADAPDVLPLPSFVGRP